MHVQQLYVAVVSPQIQEIF